MEELVKQIIIGLSGAILALIGLVPAFIKRAQEKRRTEDWQVMARIGIDIAADALAVIDRYQILESDVDEHTKAVVRRLRLDYERLLADYRGRAMPAAVADPQENQV